MSFPNESDFPTGQIQTVDVDLAQWDGVVDSNFAAFAGLFRKMNRVLSCRENVFLSGSRTVLHTVEVGKETLATALIVHNISGTAPINGTWSAGVDGSSTNLFSGQSIFVDIGQFYPIMVSANSPPGTPLTHDVAHTDIGATFSGTWPGTGAHIYTMGIIVESD